MRYRILSPSGDFTFGSGQQNFFINSPQAVGQVVLTSLRLWLGEFYLNVNAGMPYPEGVLGKHTKDQADATVVGFIGTLQGVVNVENLVSTINPNTRAYTIQTVTVNTLYGQTTLQMSDEVDF